MLSTEYVDDFAEFYTKYEEHLHKHYQDFANTFDGGRELDIDINLYQSLIDAGNANIFILKDADVFIGYVSVTITPAVLFKGQVDAIIDHFYIVEEYRGKGYADDILKEIEAQLKEDNVDHVNLALPSLDNYDVFAKKMGYTKQSSIHSKSLGDN